MKIISTSFSTLLLSAALATPALAQDHSGHAGHGSSAPVATAEASNAVMTAGEITRVDARNGKLTIRHEEIKNLDMPAMTMVFGLKEPALAAQFKPGDKVLFHAEDNNGALTITRIQSGS
jgi:Cu/Ag efflux protein CusF